MKKLFTLILGLMVAGSMFAQRPEALIVKATTLPVIDGVIDDVWAEANEYNIDKNFQQELPTLGNVGETTWKMLWDKTGMYVLLKVADDSYLPSYEITPEGYSWDYDKPELYFDVNYILEDGYGKGHYQIAPAFVADKIDGTPTIETTGVVWAVKVDKPNYVVEYFIPIGMLRDKDGLAVDLMGTVGFDVTIIDRDPGDAARKRAVWANDGLRGAAHETNGFMDESGKITFDGADDAILVDEIILAGEDITVNGQAMQLTVEILPEDAYDKTLKWLVTGDDGKVARSTISPEGLITPLVDEVIYVEATSIDGFIYSNKIKINISGQKPTLEDLNYVKNGNFNEVDSKGAPLIWQGFEAGTAQVVDGVLEFAPSSVKPNIWDYKMLQIINVPYALKDLDYVLKFKAWADEDRSFSLKIEDSNNGWPTYGISSDATSNGSTYWPVESMMITTEPTVYELHMNFANMAEDCIQNLNWQVAESTTKIYLDSVFLVSVADMALLPTSIQQNKLDASFKVYPNPASSKLHVEFSTPNTRVAIYNSVGIKMDEELVFGTHHIFDVSRYTKGLYFVKANSAVVKFTK